MNISNADSNKRRITSEATSIRFEETAKRKLERSFGQAAHILNLSPYLSFTLRKRYSPKSQTILVHGCSTYNLHIFINTFTFFHAAVNNVKSLTI